MELGPDPMELGPDPVEPGPGPSQPGAGADRSPGAFDTGNSARAIGTLLVGGLALRVIIAYLLPGSGFKIDLGAFEYWAHNLAQYGIPGFYARPAAPTGGFFPDHPPGALHCLGLV